ncbi:NFU1 iron-sulfur cluster scaffold -like protein, mitochondrial [Trichinella nativa]|uniref:NFU1 iron-sulfur cluster scaffold-like protein, mitochondrial n=1 Tax=Trichinella nativa TaxID=6335 RepID=A0A0V1KRT2_9BILA|nr:NFU1 iron-sulfur cluster scaffold -like protein, mitochondrial [Trichinella nativa]
MDGITNFLRKSWCLQKCSVFTLKKVSSSKVTIQCHSLFCVLLLLFSAYLSSIRMLIFEIATSIFTLFVLCSVMYHQLFHLIIYCGHISTTSCLLYIFQSTGLMFYNKFKPCFIQICSNILFNVLKRSMYIQVMETPNPHSLKFLPGIPVLPGRTAEFPNRPSAEKSPLARAIFRIRGVKSVFFGEDFITVTKNSEVKDWVAMKPEIFSTIMDFFTSKQNIIIDDSTEKDAADDDNDTVVMIKDLLNTRIRPTIQDDGGDVVFMVVDEVEEIAEKEFQKIAVVMNVREEIEALQNPFPGNFDDSDSDDVTKAQLVPFSSEEELVTETVSKFSRIRAANLKLLDEENPRYKGQVVNRSQLEQFTNSDEETASSSATDVSEEMDINQEPDNMIHTFSRVDLLDQKERGIAVQQQLKLWEQMLSLKIRFQKLLQSANRLPQSADYREKLLQSDDELLETFSSARRSVQKLNEALEKWYQRTRLGGIGVSAKKDFSAFESNAVAQIAQILTDRKRLIQRTQLKRLEYDIIGKEEKCADEDRNVNIFDDSDFHEQLLREFIQKRMNDITDPVLLGRHWSKFQKLRDKSKKSKVDRKASKGRRIRIQVMSKLVNFMAPVDKSKMTNETRDELFASLFGSRNGNEPSLVFDRCRFQNIRDGVSQSDVSVKFLKKLTVITDESSSAAADKSLPREKFDQFKKWFWSVVSSMTTDVKQEARHWRLQWDVLSRHRTMTCIYRQRIHAFRVSALRCIQARIFCGRNCSLQLRSKRLASYKMQLKNKIGIFTTYIPIYSEHPNNFKIYFMVEYLV